VFRAVAQFAAQIVARIIARTSGRAHPLASACALLFLLGEAAGHAQVLELNGGSSSLYQTQGGSILLRGPVYETEVGAGLISGRLVAGGRLAYRDKATTYSAGVEEVRFNLPTDLFNSDHRLLGVGVGMKVAHPETKLELFAGGSSQRFDTPLFTGVRADEPAAALILQHANSSTVMTTTQLLAANPGTALEAVQWKARPWLALAAAGGFGGTAHYEAVSADMKRPLVEMKASYVDAADNFRRVGPQTDISPEPIHENLLFTVRSSRNPRVTITGGRQNFLVPAGSVTAADGSALPNLISTSNQISASTNIKAVSLTGTLIHSGYNGQSNLALVVSASASPDRRVHLQSSFFQSRLLEQSTAEQSLGGNLVTNSIVTNVQEVLTRRLSANQTITYSNGQTSIGYGGSILSNFLTFSADYETFYVPTRPGSPFQQTLVLDLSLNLFGRVTLHGGTFVSPTGKVLYTANMHAVETRLPSPKQAEHARLGAYIVQGRVVDTAGEPIPDAAIALGNSLVFTDTAGEFFLRDNKSRTYPFKVLVDQFLDGRRYRVVSAPGEATSIKGEEQHLLIIVERIPDPSAPAEACPPKAGTQQKPPAASSSHPPCAIPPAPKPADKPAPQPAPQPGLQSAPVAATSNGGSA